MSRRSLVVGSRGSKQMYALVSKVEQDQEYSTERTPGPCKKTSGGTAGNGNRMKSHADYFDDPHSQ